MATAENAVIYLEQGATLVPYAAMTDSGDHQTFTNAADIWSGKSGNQLDLRPDGIYQGLRVVSPGAANDEVAVAAFKAYSGGVSFSVSADASVAITRPATDVSRVNSITMSELGAIEVVVGVSGASAAFSETRGANGGPPLIPVGHVEVAQVRLTTAAAGLVTASEIFQTTGQHCERSDFPTWTVNNIGSGNAADVAAETNAYVKFASALPLIHTGPVAKPVYAQYYEPTFGELAKTLDFVPAETSHSVTSKQYYNGTIGSRSSTLGQGSFVAILDDGVADGLIADKNEILTVKFLPDRNKAPYIITQGAIGVSRTFPVADQIQASVTISADTASAEFSS